MIDVKNLCKSFVLHNQGGAVLSVLRDVSLHVDAGECLVLHGPSGTGKSTILRCLYANYRTQHGTVRLRHQQRWVDMAGATPREILTVRRHTLGYVSQFLRVIPRIAALDIVMEPLVRNGAEHAAAKRSAQAWLERLNIPQRLWHLPPATFSGGEQQRINIARSLIAAPPILLLDEPTAALDGINRQVVIDLIDEAKRRGAAVAGVFHDTEVRDAVVTRLFNLDISGAPYGR